MSLETVAQIRGAGLSQECWAAGHACRLIAPSESSGEPHCAGLEAMLRPNLSPAGVNVRFPLKILVGARLGTG